MTATVFLISSLEKEEICLEKKILAARVELAKLLDIDDTRKLFYKNEKIISLENKLEYTKTKRLQLQSQSQLQLQMA